METQLTKLIKKRLRYFRPAMNPQKITVRWAEEVWTDTGIVDVIRFEDYPAERAKEVCGQAHCKMPGLSFPNKYCKSPGQNCTFRKGGQIIRVGMMITCFEVKISVSDFRSKNGHNFHGNRNYYAVPVEIADKLLPLIPDDIGLVMYYSGTGHMVVKKECIWREVAEEKQVMLLYNALKKWVDKMPQFYDNPELLRETDI